MFIMTATEAKEAKVSHVEYMLAKTQLEIVRTKFVNRGFVVMEFVSYDNENVSAWEGKMIELGYQVRALDSAIVGIRRYEVIWE